MVHYLPVIIGGFVILFGRRLFSRPLKASTKEMSQLVFSGNAKVYRSKNPHCKEIFISGSWFVCQYVCADDKKDQEIIKFRSSRYINEWMIFFEKGRVICWYNDNGELVGSEQITKQDQWDLEQMLGEIQRIIRVDARSGL